MRILFFCSFFQAEGSESLYFEELNSVIRNFPETEFIVYNINSKENKIIRLNKNILWIKRLNLRNLSVIPLFVKDMVTIFTKFKPQIIHAFNLIESIIGGILGKVFFTPSILHGRSPDVHYLPFRSIKSNILARIGCTINNLILTVSKAMRNDIINLKIPAKKIEALYDGIDYSLFTPKGKRKKLEGERFEIMNIGRYSPEKNHDIIIEALKKLKEEKYNFHVTFIGFGHKSFDNNPVNIRIGEKIRDLIKDYDLEDHITLEGFIPHDDIPDYLEKGDLYIQPSTTEGMPISVLEAMSMEMAVVLSRAGGMPELLNKPGVILVDKKNRDQLYEAIVSFIKNPDHVVEGGKKNRKLILRNFNWDKHGKQLHNHYSKLKRRKN